jgi:hypothetical protein
MVPRLPTLRDLSLRISRILTHDPFPDHLLGDFIDDFRLRAKSREKKMGGWKVRFLFEDETSSSSTKLN